VLRALSATGLIWDLRRLPAAVRDDVARPASGEVESAP
jgi:hypothetical protein